MTRERVVTDHFLLWLGRIRPEIIRSCSVLKKTWRGQTLSVCVFQYQRIASDPKLVYHKKMDEQYKIDCPKQYFEKWASKKN
jgi:hypothetical protein